jgi:flagellar basal body-associated protein FliL
VVVAVVVGIVVSLVAVVAVSVWLSRRSPAARSQEGSSSQPAAGGQDRPAGPDAEAMYAPESPDVSTSERSE